MLAEWMEITEDISTYDDEIATAMTDVYILAEAHNRFSKEGICRGDVVAIEGYAPAISGSALPLSSYSRYPSQTNLSPALEGIMSTIQDMFLKAIGKVIELIGRFIGWISRQFARGFSKSMRRTVERNIEHAATELKPAVKSGDQREIDNVFDKHRYNSICRTHLHEVLEDNIARVPDTESVRNALEQYAKATEVIISTLGMDLDTLSGAKPVEPKELHFYTVNNQIPELKTVWKGELVTSGWWWILAFTKNGMRRRQADSTPKDADTRKIVLGEIPHPGLADIKVLLEAVNELRSVERHNPREGSGALKAIEKGRDNAEAMRKTLLEVSDTLERLEGLDKRLKAAHADMEKNNINLVLNAYNEALRNAVQRDIMGALRIGQNCIQVLGTSMTVHGALTNVLKDIHEGYKAARS